MDDTMEKLPINQKGQWTLERDFTHGLQTRENRANIERTKPNRT